MFLYSHSLINMLIEHWVEYQHNVLVFSQFNMLIEHRVEYQHNDKMQSCTLTLQTDTQGWG